MGMGLAETFATADYRPELLFSEPAIAEAARVNPEALWKLKNLEQMPCGE